MITLCLTERELEAVLACLEALQQLLGDAPESDMLDRLDAKLTQALADA